MAIIGAILGDIAGSQYEFERPVDLDWEHCELFTDDCGFTDDTVMSLAIKSTLDKGADYQEEMRRIGQNYRLCGYGGMFYDWMFRPDPKPYRSYGNGSAMRVSYVADFYDDLDKVTEEATKSAEVTHNHPEGIKGAVTVATCIWMAKNGKTKQEIYDYVLSQYPPKDYKFSGLSLEELRKCYVEDISCMAGVPAAARCFYESDSYVSFIRNTFSFENDTDTFGAMFGGVAEEFYHGTGLDNEKILREYLDEVLLSILKAE